MPLPLEALPRWLGFLGAFLVIGACVFRFAVLRGWLRNYPGDLPVTDLLARRAAHLGLLGGALLLLSVPLRLWAQARGFVNPGETVDRELISLIVGETQWGRGWVAQFGAAVVALGGFLLAVLLPPWGWIGAGIGATLVALAAPLTGHAVTDAAGRTGVMFDSLHLLAGSAWLGTLAVMLLAGLATLSRLPDDQHGVLAARLVRVFSPVALAGAVVAIAAGSVLSWRYLGGSLGDRLAALTGTDWGRHLLLKNLTLAAVAAFGAWNWRVLSPRLGTAEGAVRLRRAVRVELALGVVLLFITAILVALPMPKLAAGEENAMLMSPCSGVLSC
jgi:putative copper export protein